MKTKLLSLIISLFACSLLVAQEQPIQKVDVNGVYLIPDKMPEYPGGVPAMMNFTLTVLPSTIPGVHLGISFTTRKASSSNKGSTPLITFA